MRKHLKTRNASIMGIIALAAVMCLVMVSCKEDPPSAPPPDAIFHLAADYGAYVDYPISATVRDLKVVDVTIELPKTAPSHNVNVTHDPQVAIFWVRADTSAPAIYTNWVKAQKGEDPDMDQDGYVAYVQSLQNAAAFHSQVVNTSTPTANTSPKGLLFKPSAAGKYAAGIVDFDSFKAWSTGTANTSCPTPLFSKNVIEVASGTPNSAYADYMGKWEMNYTFIPAGGEPGGKEVLKIGDDTFRIFLNQKDEGIHFSIKKVNGWTAVPNTALTFNVPKVENGIQVQTGPDASRVVSKTFTGGYTLEVDEVLLNMGYTDYTKFNVYKDSESNVTLGRTNQAGTNSTTVVRLYATRTAPQNIGLTAQDEDWTVTGESAN